MTDIDTSTWCMLVPSGDGATVCRCGGSPILQPGEVLDMDVLEVVRCNRTGALLGSITTLDDYMATRDGTVEQEQGS